MGCTLFRSPLTFPQRHLIRTKGGEHNHTWQFFAEFSIKNYFSKRWCYFKKIPKYHPALWQGLATDRTGDKLMFLCGLTKFGPCCNFRKCSTFFKDVPPTALSNYDWSSPCHPPWLGFLNPTTPCPPPPKGRLCIPPPFSFLLFFSFLSPLSMPRSPLLPS
jgi:hypothetical protein